MFNKDCLLGVLISYVVMDILFGILIYKENQDAISEVKETVDKNQKMIILIVIISLGVGCLLSNCYGCHKLLKW